VEEGRGDSVVLPISPTRTDTWSAKGGLVLNGDPLFLTLCVAVVLCVWLMVMYIGGGPRAK
jgi:hypothetical protein